MKTLIVGAGIVGAIYGWAFAEAGNDVTHLVRPGKSPQFADGLDIDMYDVRKGHKRNFTGHYPIRVTETIQPADGYDLLIVPTKHYHLLQTLRDIVPQAGNADYFLLTQNWDGTEPRAAGSCSARTRWPGASRRGPAAPRPAWRRAPRRRRGCR